MIATTPSGTRTRSISSPFGRVQPSSTSPTGSGRLGDRPQAVRHAFQAGVGEPQAIERPFFHAADRRGFEVGFVRGLDLGRPLEQQVGGGGEDRVLGRAAGSCQGSARHFRSTAELVDGGSAAHSAPGYLLTDRSSPAVSSRRRRLVPVPPPEAAVRPAPGRVPPRRDAAGSGRATSAATSSRRPTAPSSRARSPSG